MMEFLLGALFGFGLAVFILNRAISKVVDSLREEINEIDKKTDAHRIELAVEVDGNTYLCYNNSTKAFVCQGTSLKEIQQHFKDRFPDFDGVIVSAPVEVLKALKQQLKDSKNEDSSSIGRTP
jgi:hypothetical protein